MTMPIGAVEDYDQEVEPQFTVPTMPVHVVSSDAPPSRQVAAEHGYWRTFLISPSLGAQSATPGAVRIANRSLRRRRLLIKVSGAISNTNAFAATTITPGNPAAGANFVYTNTSGQGQTLQSLRFTFTTSATVLNRFLSVVFKDASGNITAQVFNGPAITATTTTISDLFQGYSAAWNQAAGTTANGPLPSTAVIPPGGTLTIQAAPIDPVDTFTGITMSVSGPTQSATDGVILGNSGVINSGQPMTPLQGIGAGYVAIGDSLRWEVQQELWAAYPASNVGNVLVTVCDEAYASEPLAYKQEEGENT